MKNEDIIRAWKDASYRAELGDDAQAGLPVNPAGMLELDDDALHGVAGAKEAAIIYPTISIQVTIAASCSDSCGYTFDGGTCRLLTAGCCEQ